MKRTGCAIALALMSACTPGSSVKISNVTQGLARVEPSGQWKIYSEGSKFTHEVNGTCVADGKTIPCMWFAVAFDYSANADSTVLTCKGTFSKPTDLVTPNEVIASGTSEHTSTAELRGRKGRAFWQGYSIADGDTTPHTTSVACEHKGRIVLRYAFTITEQAKPAVDEPKPAT